MAKNTISKPTRTSITKPRAKTPTRQAKEDTPKGVPLATVLKSTPNKITYNAMDVKVMRPKKSMTSFGAPELLFTTVSDETASDEPPTKHLTVVRLVNRDKDRVWLSCNCDNFLYQWEYALAKHGGADIVYGNGEPAIVTNPKNIPGCCKHLYRVLRRKDTLSTLRSMAR